ncbi:MAG TPA: hypothetical protein VF331_08780 [Polyangiales bacterium]
MVQAHLFWIALFIPGFALVRRLDPAALRDGPLSTLARSYLGTFALLTPLSVAGYVFRLPLAVFSYGLVACVVAGVLWLCIDRGWLRELRWPTALGVCCSAILAADMVLGARVGTNLGGDAGFHIARARMLADHGFNSWDPLVAGHRFEPIYHSNIYHALLAAGAQLCRTHPGTLWITAWPWAKLMSAAAAYHLAVAVFEERALGWAAAVGACIFVAPYSVLPYPNTLGPYWLMSMGIAFGVEALVAGASYRAAGWLAAATLALTQTHMLFAVFLALVVAPPLLLMAARATFRKLPGRRPLWAATLALGLSLPWLLVPAWPRIQAVVFPAPPPAAAPAANSGSAPAAAPPPASGWLGRQNAKFIELGHGMLVANPAPLIGTDNRYTHLVLLLALGLVSRRRKRVAAIGAIVLSACAVLFVPPLCAVVLELAGERWILWRMTLVFIVIIFAVVPNTLLWLAQPFARQRWLALVWPWLAVLASAGYAWQLGVNGAPWSREGYLAQAKRLTSSYRIHAIQDTSAFFAKNVRSEETIIAAPGDDYFVAMHCDCNVLAPAPGRGSHGLGADEVARRHAAIGQLFSAQTPPTERLAILQRYGVQTVFTSKAKPVSPLTAGLSGYVKRIARWRGMRVVTFKLPGER